MGFSVCGLTINLVMESVTRKGREACLEPSQFHDLFFYGGESDDRSRIQRLHFKGHSTQ